MELVNSMNNKDHIWVFGYGSLCWNPGFDYESSMIGWINGFKRKFWQGNTTHRGTIDKPGRVVTLVDDKEGMVCGRAFLIRQNNSAMPYLEDRECSLGGYVSTTSTFYSRNGETSFPVLVFIANNKNPFWLGEAATVDIARQIVQSSGPSGHNVEYLFRLADFMRGYFPEIQDEHLYTLEMYVRSIIESEHICLTNLIGKRNLMTEVDDIDSQGNYINSNDNEFVIHDSMMNNFEKSTRVHVGKLSYPKS